MMGERRLACWARTKMVCTALIMCAVGALLTPALAASPQFREIEIGGGFNVETITVEQQDGKWTRISDHPRTIPIHVTIRMSRGYIVFYRIGRNLTNGAVRNIFTTHTLGNGGSSENPIEARINARTSVAGPVNILIDEFTRLNASDEQAIVNRCNSKWTEIDAGHSFSYSLPLAMHADARERRRKRFPYYLNEYEGYGDFARATATGFVGLKVECLGKSKPPRTSSDTSKPPSGSDTPRRSDADVPKTPDNQDLRFDHGAMSVNGIKLTLTTYANVYTEPNPGTRCKKARLRVTIEANQQGPVPFMLWEQHGNGAVRSEEFTRMAHHDDGYFRAIYERWVEVDETTRVQFNARDLINETFNKETGWKGITLHCTGGGGGGLTAPTEDPGDGLPSQEPKPQVNPAVGSGARGIVTEPDATHAQPNRTHPRQPQVVCAGGRVARGSCLCGSGKIRKRIGSRQFQCIAVAKPSEKKEPVRTSPKGKSARLVCEGGRISNGTCRCGSSRKLVRVGRNAFVCQMNRVVRSDATPRKKAAKPTRVPPKRGRAPRR